MFTNSRIMNFEVFRNLKFGELRIDYHTFVEVFFENYNEWTKQKE